MGGGGQGKAAPVRLHSSSGRGDGWPSAQPTHSVSMRKGQTRGRAKPACSCLRESPAHWRGRGLAGRVGFVKGAFFKAGWRPQEEGRQWRLVGGRGRVAKRNVSSLGVFPPERQALLPQLGLLPLTAVWGQSPSPMASSLLFLLLSPWQPASLGCANRKGPLCPERGWMGGGVAGQESGA